MRYVITIFSICWVFISCSHVSVMYNWDEKTKKQESETVQSLIRNHHEKRVAEFPEYATKIGSKVNYDKFNNDHPNYDPEYLKVIEQEYEKASGVKDQALDEEARFNFQILISQLTHERNQWEYKDFFNPINYIDGSHVALPNLMFNLHTISNEQDALAYINRLRFLDSRLDKTLAHLKKQQAKGLGVAKSTINLAIKKCEELTAGWPYVKGREQDNPFYRDFEDKIKHLGAFTDSQKKSLLESIKLAISRDVVAPYRKFISELKKLRELAPKNYTLSELEGGDEYYQLVLDTYSQDKISAEKLHASALNEVQGLLQTLDLIRKGTSWESLSRTEFFNFLKTEAQFSLKSEEDSDPFLQMAKEAIIDIRSRSSISDPHVDDYFLVVQKLKSYSSAGYERSSYQPPSITGSRPGIFQIKSEDAKTLHQYQLKAMAVAHTFPGAHLQMASILGKQQLPEFRKVLMPTSYVNGWSLFSLDLAKEQGLFDEIKAQIGRLTLKLYYAARVVVDTGIHFKNWSRTEALAYLNTHTPSPADENLLSVEASLSSPGRVTSYYLGRMELEKLHNKFNYKNFGEMVLSIGPAPFDLLENKLEQLSLKTKGSH